MVFCAYCGKSFTRKEHLERHIPSRESPSSSSRVVYMREATQTDLSTPQIPTSNLIAAARVSSRLLEGKLATHTRPTSLLGSQS